MENQERCKILLSIALMDERAMKYNHLMQVEVMVKPGKEIQTVFHPHLLVK